MPVAAGTGYDKLRASIKNRTVVTLFRHTMNELALRATWRDYLEMCKPRVIVLMLLCAVVGMFLATPAAVPLELVLCASLGIALVAGSAAVVNHLADQHIDARMARTESRPMAMGRITNSQAVIFAGIIGVLGIALLWFLVNPLTAWLNLASWVGYGLIYTLYLLSLIHI